MTPLEFATQKLAEGVEILCRNNRLRIWPGRAFRHFTSAELAFINDHKEELKAIAVAKTFPGAGCLEATHRCGFDDGATGSGS